MTFASHRHSFSDNYVLQSCSHCSTKQVDYSNISRFYVASTWSLPMLRVQPPARRPLRLSDPGLGPCLPECWAVGAFPGLEGVMESLLPACETAETLH